MLSSTDPSTRILKLNEIPSSFFQVLLAPQSLLLSLSGFSLQRRSLGVGGA